MSQICAVTKCNRAFRGLCDCCQQNLCLQHLNEHNVSLISQLNPLTDEINALGDRLRTLDTEKAVGSVRRKLEAWRNDCHEKIDGLFRRKWQELDRLVEEKVKKQQQELVQIQSRVAELICEQETTRQDINSLTLTIGRLKEQMDKIEHKCFDISTRTLMIDDSFVAVREINEVDLSILSPVCKTIDRLEGSSRPFVSNDRFLLIHQVPNLCLVDSKMKIVNQILWSYGPINDMCWSATLNRFIVIGKQTVHLVNESTMMIENVRGIKERSWLSCTCSETFFFLSTNEPASSIVGFTLLPAIELINEWKSPYTCARFEYIHGIRYHSGKIALIIMDEAMKSLRIELKDAETLTRIWSLPLEAACNQNIAFRFCLLPDNEWLVAQHETGSLLHITKDGNLKKVIQYEPNPYRVSLMGLNKLIVLTKDKINLHKI